ncbi:hypothetical protein [Paracerasibacillus soli]|uniref:Bacterial purine repressor N-terminal domain-containing protein n=1 Tax=Paracerasibacillus soli TaxID=480284 RepID=A0ABU5CUE2_9BACI|nr:hypothetical protein [Virgibacillus soli]MDY0409999.1 hypothetical protein [Virgibacillus soli]
MNRNERLIGLISYFLMNPRKHQTLNFFSEKFHAGKTSISEDLDILNELFKKEKVGFLERVKGRAGGVKFIPKLTLEQSEQFIGELCEQLHDSSRVLPGGYLYMSDLLGRQSLYKK